MKHTINKILFTAFFITNVFGAYAFKSSPISDKQKENLIQLTKQRQYHFSQKETEYYSLNATNNFRIKIKNYSQKLISTKADFSYELNLKNIYCGAFDYINNDFSKTKIENERLTETHQFLELSYCNSANGLKQDITLNNRIGEGDFLHVNFEFSSEKLTPKLKNNDVIYTDKFNNELGLLTGLLVKDKYGKILSSEFSVHKNIIAININLAQAIFPITIDPLSTTPSTQVVFTQAQAQMGYSVSSAGDVNGDGFSDVIVGAPLYDNGQTDEGAVFVYYGSSNGLNTSAAWSVEGNQTLSVFSGTYIFTSTGFGTSVSEAGDVNNDGYGDVIIGAPFFTNGNNGEGKVFLYYGSATGLPALPNWTYEPNVDSALAGFSVSTAGDINNDGFSDVIIGEPGYANGQVKEGAALIFHGSVTGLPAAPNTILEENFTNSLYGWSAACAGDVNGDNFDDVIVSSVYYESAVATRDEGKAWVYHGSAAGITVAAAWTTESNRANCYYGENVSWAGDVNGDGYGDVLVGADYYTNPSLNEGACYVYHGSATGLNTVVAIILESNFASAYFGVGVNGAGDVNGDGYADIVVGAYGLSNGSSSEGAGYVFYGSSTGLSNALKTALEPNVSNTGSGISVSTAGDVNGDGFSDIVVGAYLFDKITPLATNAGCIYVYNGLPEIIGTTTIPAAPYTGTQASQGLGNFVTTVGDVNGDGFSDLAVGSSLFDNVQTDRGVVYIFHGSATGYSAAPNTTINGPAFTSARFGFSIGAAGDVNGDGYSDIIVGAPGFNSGGTASEGAAFVYLGSSAGINTTIHLQIEGNQTSAQLGYSVSGAGDVNGDGYSDILIGAKTYNTVIINEGKLLVYYGSITGVDNVLDWSYTSGYSEQLGTCVAGVGDCNGDGYSDIIAVSSNYSNPQTNEGRILYFRGSATGLESAPGSLFETNVANAAITNQSSSYVGDINADGFNDIVVGTQAYNNAATTNEGALLIWYGASPSLYFGSQQIVDANVANSYLGATVGFGGDVNGDGYQDIITGSPLYANGSINEGQARIYLGAAIGLNTTSYWQFEPNAVGISAGSSVSSAGDINADGFSDIVVGANNYDAGAAPVDVGIVYTYFGNNSHGVLGMSFLSKQLKSNLVSIVQSSNGTFEAGCAFGTSHAQKSYLGRVSGRLVYEVRGHPDPFNNYAAAVGNSVFTSGAQPLYTNLGLNGATLTMSITAAAISFPKWRVRLQTKLVDAIDCQKYSRWFYGSIHDKQDRSIKINSTCGALPIELVYFTSRCINNQAEVEWQMLDETNVSNYTLYELNQSGEFELLGTLENKSLGIYRFVLPASEKKNKIIRLMIVDQNNNNTRFEIEATSCFSDFENATVYPNPSNQMIDIKISADVKVKNCFIYDASGAMMLNLSNQNSVDVSKFESGIYFLRIIGDDKKSYFTRFVRE